MLEAVTDGVKVSVLPTFQPHESSYEQQVFIFSYQITITNQSPFAVQLLKRHWKIKDSNGDNQEVIGDGVVGEQPIIPPGDSHTYRSFCNLRTDIGFMSGKYLMEKKSNNNLFEVNIPKFSLEVPYRKN